VDDLVLLDSISEGKIVEALQNRYAQDLIYTNIASVLIAVRRTRHSQPFPCLLWPLSTAALAASVPCDAHCCSQSFTCSTASPGRSFAVLLLRRLFCAWIGLDVRSIRSK
jgi:hypothetical protein